MIQNPNSKSVALSDSELTAVQNFTAYFNNSCILNPYLPNPSLNPVLALIWAFRKFNQEYKTVWNGSDETYHFLSQAQTSDFFYRLIVAYHQIATYGKHHSKSLRGAASGFISLSDYESFLKVLKSPEKTLSLEQILEKK